MTRPSPPPDTPILPADDPDALDQAARILKAGGCVAVPTETVYGLACDATNAQAVAGVYEAKGRPSFNPLICHVDTLERARSLVQLDDQGLALAERFWPGPLTLVAPKRTPSPVSELAAAGLDSLAVRLPYSDTLRTLVQRLDAPLAAPSANASGTISPTTAEHVKDSLNGRIHLILDGGPCPVGVESTIVSVLDPAHPVILRPGGIARDALEAVIGVMQRPTPTNHSAPTAPGQLTSHYAPNASVRLNATQPHNNESFLGFGAQPKREGVVFFDLSPSGDLVEAAANLFTGLRWLDRVSDRIAVAPIPETGLGEAINDRLRRAAAER
ncbi:L-threonylcarbamoyladenylate synthase [Oceanicaulis alexandrii]|uniref:L-threonylcarbamoyladenylate synthase n=1 Tax=Oceanicaulis alexandrii TaxID=153233 RepID=UPI0003B64C1B|nr:L-threonylcarbamoyladenylate synthase [Oceanicaulis alexandrii]